MLEDRKNLLIQERDEELRKIHERIVSNSGINKKYLTRDFIVEQIQKCSAPRFYITEIYARLLVKSYYNHRTKRKRDMVEDLLQVYEEVRETNVNATVEEIWEKVVEHPAKSFYLSPARIMEIIFQYHDRKVCKKK